MRTMEKMQDEGRARDAKANGTSTAFKSHGSSLEVTGLGMIAALILAFGSLVTDGTLLFAQYLVFVAFLLVSAGGLAWRLCKLHSTDNAGRVQPGVYRVTFGDHGSTR
ncbi:MAG TPA: hypothetical protein VIY99_20065 [Terracidiphilus sp.]